MKFIGYIAALFLIIGGLNWGLIGLANFNLVATLLGQSGLDRLVYIIVGLSAVWEIYAKFVQCRSCSSK